MSAREKTAWRGDLLIGPGWARFVGRAGPAPSLACASTRIAVAMCSWIGVACGDAAEPRRVPGVVVAADATLVIDPVRLYSQVVFVDARFDATQRIGAQRTSSADAIGRERAAHWRRAIYSLARDDEVARVVRTLLPNQGGSGEESAASSEKEAAEALREWARAADVAAACRRGATLGSAVRDSGFASLRQCQATYLRLFGLTPALLLGLADHRGAAPT